MLKFSEYLDYINENDKNQELAVLNIDNNKYIYNVAMKAKDPKDLKIAMLKMKIKFPDVDKINFDKLDWKEIYTSLNEKKERVDNQGKPLTDKEKKAGLGICDCGNKAKLNRRGECKTCSSFD